MPARRLWGALSLLALYFLDIGGVTEETGWRGFTLPLLQARKTPLAPIVVTARLVLFFSGRWLGLER